MGFSFNVFGRVMNLMRDRYSKKMVVHFFYMCGNEQIIEEEEEEEAHLDLVRRTCLCITFI